MEDFFCSRKLLYNADFGFPLYVLFPFAVFRASAVQVRFFLMFSVPGNPLLLSGAEPTPWLPQPPTFLEISLPLFFKVFQLVPSLRAILPSSLTCVVSVFQVCPFSFREARKLSSVLRRLNLVTEPPCWLVLLEENRPRFFLTCSALFSFFSPFLMPPPLSWSRVISPSRY